MRSATFFGGWMSRTLIERGYVVTVDASRSVFPCGYVSIVGDTISCVGASRPTGQFDRIVDAAGMIVVPGLINAHQHLYYHLMKGAGHGLLIEDWFPELVNKVGPHLNDDDMELTARLGAVEMLLSGTTCCLNHLRLPSTEKTLERLAAATVPLGLRQLIGKEMQCRLPGNPFYPRTLSEEASLLDDLIPRWKSREQGLIRLSLVVECNAIFIDQRVTSEELLIAGHDLAARHDLKISSHLSAGTLSFDKSYLQVLRRTGRSETRMLAELGILDSRYTFAHGINCTSTDIAMLADAGASVVYTPTSEALRGGGIGPATEMLAAGVNVALGSDGPMVDDSVDMIEQMKACSMLQNVKHLNPNALRAERALEMATIRAARALGLDDEIGSLEAGKLADIAVFDLQTAHATPANNPIASVVHSVKGTDAAYVFVNGREVVGRGRLTADIDLQRLFATASERAQQLIDVSGIRGRLAPDWALDPNP